MPVYIWRAVCYSIKVNRISVCGVSDPGLDPGDNYKF